MSYEKRNFVSKSPLYASELNHMEDGIADVDSRVETLEQNYSEIMEVFSEQLNNKVDNTITINSKPLSSNIVLTANDVSALPNTTVIPSISGLASETYVNNKVANLVSQNELETLTTQVITQTLNSAKESGEFDGTSVEINSINQSTAAGGNSVINFSDGKTLTIKNGSDGATPVRGTHYWTEADKAEIKDYVDQAILGGSW